MIIQQHFLPTLSTVFSDGSNHCVCQHKSPLFRLSERWNVLSFPGRLKYGISSDTYLMHHPSQRVAYNWKLRCSQDEPGERNLGKEANDLDGHSNSEENKGVGESTNMEKTVSQEEQRLSNKSEKRGLWQVFSSGGRSKKKGNTRKKSSTNKYDEKKVKNPSRLPHQRRAFDQRSKEPESELQFLNLFYVYGENLLVLLLTGLLVLATGQILVQLLLVSVSILITAVKYSAIAAILLGILVALL